MVSINKIEQFGRDIGKTFNPQKVILFGSYLDGSPDEDSDVDFLIITDFKGKSIDKSVDIRMKLRPGFPVDLLVRTPQKIKERLEMGDGFIKDILENGKVVYETDNS